ncbi:MAG: hypothetical protein M3680_29400 [Myxococcota bacterium]|nr:hypothetical protein [Myxococcota bacterium]
MRPFALITLGLLGLLAATAPAHADLEVAADEEPPPPPPPPVLIVTPLAVAAPTPPSTRPPPRPPLSDRWTLTPATGVLWMQVHGATGSGMLLQPTLTRTFDRLELQADYLLAHVTDDAGAMPGALVHRLGASAHYQAGRIRVERTMALDLVTSAGVGLQRVMRDDGRSLDRPDLSVGIGLRMLTDIIDRPPQRVFFGMEVALRLLVVPRRDASPDLGLAIAFGIPLGR